MHARAVYLSFQGQMPMYKVIGTSKDIKVHNTRPRTGQSQRQLMPALSVHRLHSGESGG